MATKDDNAELKAYRNRKDYTGNEDYTPSGRAALRTYTANEKPPFTKAKFGPSYSPAAAKAAQEAQRDTMNEMKRESRGTAPEEELKKGGKVKKYARGGGIEIKGKTKGKMC